MAVTPQIELDRIQNPSQEVLDEIASIIDKYTKTSILNGQPIKHLSKDGTGDKIFKEIKTKGKKKPSISKPLFARVLAENIPEENICRLSSIHTCSTACLEKTFSCSVFSTTFALSTTFDNFFNFMYSHKTT